MGLFNRLIADAGVERAMGLLGRMKAPSGISDAEWQVIRDRMGKGNTELVDAMNFGGLSANWEHGGLASPRDPLKTVTSQSPTTVGIPAPVEGDGKAFIYHSHPHHLTAESGEAMPAALSIGDLRAALPSGGVRGITSLDPLGGFAYAIRNEQTPNIKPATWDQMQIDAVNAAKTKLEGVSPNWIRSGVEGSQSLRSQFAPPTDADPAALAATLGMGRALSRANVLTEFGSLPVGEAQIAGAVLLEPAVEESAQAAQEIVSNWLKMNGFSSGEIRAALMSLGAGGALTMAAQITGEAQNA